MKKIKRVKEQNNSGAKWIFLISFLVSLAIISHLTAWMIAADLSASGISGGNVAVIPIKAHLRRRMAGILSE